MVTAKIGGVLLSASFYRAFEDKYRGSGELIKERVSVYLPFITPLKEIYPDGKILDIGCGRGEWLELLRENNFKGSGVDLDDGMLSECRELDLDVANCDGIKHLLSLPSESMIVISAFHFVEHISFEQLRTLVSEAFRVLKPGGLLIMETPNPENIVVATNNFYLDPTHQCPIPAQLLSFIPEYYGFARVKTLRLQESKEIHHRKILDLNDVLWGVSPDFAVIAQKPADQLLLDHTAFAKDYGVSLSELAARYDLRYDDKLAQVDVMWGVYLALKNSLVVKLFFSFRSAYKLLKRLLRKLIQI